MHFKGPHPITHLKIVHPMHPPLSTLLDDIILQLQLDPPPAFSEKIMAYLDLLDRWNRAYNLTAILDPYDRMVKHIADSLAVAPYIPIQLEGAGFVHSSLNTKPGGFPKETRPLNSTGYTARLPNTSRDFLRDNASTKTQIFKYERYITGTPARWLDVGSGAGLPGIPLALLFPQQQWTLLDKNAKKTRFLVQAKAVLGLGNVTVIQGSVESFQPAQAFDGVICRAWTQLEEMCAKTQHLAPATLWAMKGLCPDEELSRMTAAYTVYPVQVPYLKEERHLIRIALSA
jgi:16S rRNA (guanine(527)-N(7))-methyltransferase RsmG